MSLSAITFAHSHSHTTGTRPLHTNQPSQTPREPSGRYQGGRHAKRTPKDNSSSPKIIIHYSKVRWRKSKSGQPTRHACSAGNWHVSVVERVTWTRSLSPQDEKYAIVKVMVAVIKSNWCFVVINREGRKINRLRSGCISKYVISKHRDCSSPAPGSN